MAKVKLKILSMVEDGTISVDEAMRLLEAVKNDADLAREDGAKTISNLAGNVEASAKELKAKLKEVYKEMEPKVKSTTKIVAVKTAKIVDELSKSLNDAIKNLDEPCCEAGAAQESDFADFEENGNGTRPIIVVAVENEDEKKED